MNVSWGLDQESLKRRLDVEDIEVWHTEGTTVVVDAAFEKDVFATIGSVATVHTELEDVSTEVITGLEVIWDIGSVTGDLEWRGVE